MLRGNVRDTCNPSQMFAMQKPIVLGPAPLVVDMAFELLSESETALRQTCQTILSVPSLQARGTGIAQNRGYVLFSVHAQKVEAVNGILRALRLLRRQALNNAHRATLRARLFALARLQQNPMNQQDKQIGE